MATIGPEVEVQKVKGFAPVTNSVSYLMNISQQVAVHVAGAQGQPEKIKNAWAYTIVDYEIVQRRALRR